LSEKKFTDAINPKGIADPLFPRAMPLYLDMPEFQLTACIASLARMDRRKMPGFITFFSEMFTKNVQDVI
jgi:hypothetical protein